MDFSQAGKARSPEMKYQKQLMGILAEIYSQLLLEEIVADAQLKGNWQVVRYDDVRTDNFRSPANEYDIKLSSKAADKSFIIESRSSMAHNRSLENAIKQFDIIGPYVSATKLKEDYSDIFIRPLYEFTPWEKEKYNPEKFSSYLENAEVKLHLVAACTKKEMLEHGYLKSMSQQGTQYNSLKILDGHDIDSLTQLVKDTLIKYEIMASM